MVTNGNNFDTCTYGGCNHFHTAHSSHVDGTVDAHIIVQVNPSDQDKIPAISDQIRADARKLGPDRWVITTEVIERPDAIRSYIVVEMGASSLPIAQALRDTIQTNAKTLAPSATAKLADHYPDTDIDYETEYVDKYTRGYFKISGPSDTNALLTLAEDIMERASDFMVHPTDSNIIMHRPDAPLDSIPPFKPHSIVCRADVVKEGSEYYLMAPFVSMTTPVPDPDDAHGTVGVMEVKVNDVAKDHGASVSSRIMVKHHQGAPGIISHLGHEEIHQQGNSHGSSFG